ncbi:hypothetical protein [Planctopirus hydrillae]|nr:hypothetical protein [Planctopirus hydrillae]
MIERTGHASPGAGTFKNHGMSRAKSNSLDERFPQGDGLLENHRRNV